MRCPKPFCNIFDSREGCKRFAQCRGNHCYHSACLSQHRGLSKGDFPASHDEAILSFDIQENWKIIHLRLLSC